MLLEDEDGEYLDMTPSIRSKVTYEPSVKVTPRPPSSKSAVSFNF
jgi:hypothetical protein